MEIAILEMPLDQHYKVRLDGEHLPGHIVRVPQEDTADTWQVTMEIDGVEKVLKKESLTRESAACLMLHHHFEVQVKRHMGRANDDS